MFETSLNPIVIQHHPLWSTPFLDNYKSTKKEQIQKLACFISNKISNQTNLVTTTLPLDVENLQELDSRKILVPTDKIQLYLEVGNIQASKEDNTLLNYSKISNAIKDAIKLYYS